AVAATAVSGLIQELAGNLGRAPSAGYELASQDGWEQGLTGLAGVLLILRAWALGGVALTGVGEIVRAVPGFRRPKSRNAATTLLMLGLITGAMLLSVMHLAGAVGVRLAADPATGLLDHGAPLGAEYHQEPVLAQIAAAVFAGFPPMFYLVSVTTGLVLVLAADTAFSGFPALAGALGRDQFLPRRLSRRGDRPAYARRAIVLWVGAVALIAGCQASVSRLVQLYIVGLLISLTLAQIGVVRHWNQQLATATDPTIRRRVRRSRIINSVGAVLTGAALLLLVPTSLAQGAWAAPVIASAVLVGLYLAMSGIRRHYRRFDREIAISGPDTPRLTPARLHAVVLVSRLHRPALRALNYALSTQPSSIEAVTVDVGDGAADQLLRDWADAELPVPLTVLNSPLHDVIDPVVSYVRSARADSPRELVGVFLPEYRPRRWWEQALHNRTAQRLRAALRLTPGVVVAPVPWWLGAPSDRDNTHVAIGRRPAGSREPEFRHQSQTQENA
ncbi:APC family permease, partial [Actinomyces sp. 594]|uniref:amino acid permease n=1 Tax=Actinomyces sp. 594 TaxID=2057793 RepID=UPI001C56F1F9